MNSPNQPHVMANPSVYIDITINGQKHVYDVPTARQLQTALAGAIQQLDIASGAKAAGTAEEKTPHEPPSPDDEIPCVDDAEEGADIPTVS